MSDAASFIIENLISRSQQKKDEEKQRARQFKALVDYADSAGIMSKDQASVMDLDSLRGKLEGAAAKNAIAKAVAAMKEDEARAAHTQAITKVLKTAAAGRDQFIKKFNQSTAPEAPDPEAIVNAVRSGKPLELAPRQLSPEQIYNLALGTVGPGQEAEQTARGFDYLGQRNDPLKDRAIKVQEGHLSLEEQKLKDAQGNEYTDADFKLDPEGNPTHWRVGKSWVKWNPNLQIGPGTSPGKVRVFSPQTGLLGQLLEAVAGGQAGQPAATPPAQPAAGAPALPADKTKWKTGQRYLTNKGELTWDGTRFVQ